MVIPVAHVPEGDRGVLLEEFIYDCLCLVDSFVGFFCGSGGFTDKSFQYFA